jgi:Co/Zn/Cd efflux system component
VSQSPLTGDAHHHDHWLGASPSVSQRTMTSAVIVTLAFAGAEAAAGWIGHSLALLSDAEFETRSGARGEFSWSA